MSAVLIETLVWTGALIGGVLLLRRPVSRSFGPEAAYALWALPLLRLVLPPLTLPAWMAPQAAAPAVAAMPASEPVLLTAAADTAPAAAPVEAAPPAAGFDLLAMLGDLPWIEIVLLVWLAGALVTVALRFSAYFSLRDALLAEGREVGRAKGRLGKIRLVETPATTAPLAMGVLDPVIALPPGFMALHDRAARDLALAHELAHHRGGDLLVNVLVQPLFALHWWNPLGRYGWLALRRDQEAACDARVMADRGAAERAAYAALIARFAATSGGAVNDAALTAPMACPVLGEKSIIHRLRSLKMSNLSPRRRLAGRALLGAGLLALPLTASISYAASETDAPTPPAPPAAPGAPDAPDVPPPPPPPGAPHVMIFEKRLADGAAAEGGEQVTEQVIRGEDGKETRVKIVMRGAPGAPGGPDREAMEKHFKALKSGSKAEREAAIAALRADMEARRGRGDVMMFRHPMPPMPPMGAKGEMPPMPPIPPVMVMSGCKPGSSEMVETSEDKDGRQRIMICSTRIAEVARTSHEEARAGLAEARAGLEAARAEIAAEKDIPEATRKQVLQTLDAQIANLSAKGK
jgi:beta-lactamase regulating signal transducer with metallopeptidase domain